MKNRYLIRKSMAVILLPIIIISFAIVMVSTYFVEAYFREDSFKVLQDAAEQFHIKDMDLLRNDPPTRWPEKEGQSTLPPHKRFEEILKADDYVQDTLVVKKNDAYYDMQNEEYLVDFFAEGLGELENGMYQGEVRSEEGSVYYVLKPLSRAETSLEIYYMVYISSSSSKAASQAISQVIIIGMGLVVIIIIALSYVVFRHIGKRLRHLEDGADAIGHGRFDTSFEVAPYDEIGRLGQAMQRMSRQLQLIQEEQAENFQMISHELKTPIMVMQGYIDAMIHDQFPSGTREATYKVVMDELTKLEKMTKDIIVLNKIDYLSRNKIQMEPLDLKVMFEEAFDKLNLNDKIHLEIAGQHPLMADRDSWERIIENILSNNLRYARSVIRVEMSESIRIVNDGPHIDQGLIDRITSPFVKGRDGRSGLGLTIVINTLKLYYYTLSVRNIDEGVEYKIVKGIHV